jgi:hypothetical protein
MDAIRIIQDDHDAVRRLFEQLATSRSRTAREAIACQIIAELSIQVAVEAEVLFPAVRRIGGENASYVIEGLVAHHVARLAFDTLDGMHASDERFATMIGELRESVERHFDAVESDLLPLLSRSFDFHQLDALGAAIVSTASSAPGRVAAASASNMRRSKPHGQVRARQLTAEARRLLVDAAPAGGKRPARRRRISVVRSMVRASSGPLGNLLGD